MALLGGLLVTRFDTRCEARVFLATLVEQVRGFSSLGAAFDLETHPELIAALANAGFILYIEVDFLAATILIIPNDRTPWNYPDSSLLD